MIHAYRLAETVGKFRDGSPTVREDRNELRRRTEDGTHEIAAFLPDPGTPVGGQCVTRFGSDEPLSNWSTDLARTLRSAQ
jgi:hypothetical protein